MKRLLMMSALAALGTSPNAFATGTSSPPPSRPDFSVVPFVINNGRNVVASQWQNALGCPKDSSEYGCGFTGGTVNDGGNQGLLLSKTIGIVEDPTASIKAGAELKGVRGIQVHDLGYDVRKTPVPFGPAGPAGSHCGYRSPRFEITTMDRQGHSRTTNMFGDGCLVPPPVIEPEPTSGASPSTTWQRLRWVAPNTASVCNVQDECVVACLATPGIPADPTNCQLVDISPERVQRIRIIFDDGPDPSAGGALLPDMFALAVLDNIDVNGKLVGSGPTKASYDDEDQGEGHDGNGHDWNFRGSPSHPRETEFQYSDSSSGKNVQGVNGARSTTYSTGPLGEKCVNIVGDALVNGSAGYLYNFIACDLWLLGGLGSYSVSVTGGPLGTVPYQQTGAVTSGYVSIHGM